MKKIVIPGPKKIVRVPFAKTHRLRFALLIVDMEIYPKIGKPLHMKSGGWLELDLAIGKLERLIRFCSLSGIPVLFSSEGGEKEIIPELIGASNDPVTGIKYSSSLIKRRTFYEFLEEQDINTLILTGFDLAICCEATLFDGLDLGYNVLTSPDVLFGNALEDDEHIRGWLRWYSGKVTRYYPSVEDMMAELTLIMDVDSLHNKIRGN